MRWYTTILVTFHHSFGLHLFIKKFRLLIFTFYVSELSRVTLLVVYLFAGCHDHLPVVFYMLLAVDYHLPTTCQLSVHQNFFHASSGVLSYYSHTMLGSLTMLQATLAADGSAALAESVQQEIINLQQAVNKAGGVNIYC